MSPNKATVSKAAKRLFPLDPNDDNNTEGNNTTDNHHKNPHRKKPFYTVRQLDASQSLQTNDEVHSSIDIGPVMRAIMDTPAFQRLRGIQQLARADGVFINCNHSRFEHSLGVAHLAERLAQRIRTHQPALPTSSKDTLCVTLGGMVHDMGHGPFSHVYEVFVMQALPAYRREHAAELETNGCYDGVPDLPPGWNHEMVSLLMLDNALEYLGLRINLHRLDDPLEQVGPGVDAKSMKCFATGEVLTSRDFVFIKECIYGGPIPEVRQQLGLHKLIGRTDPSKEWLYDIVTNRHSGLDVDKIDYFARDARRAFRGSGEINRRMIDSAVVAWVQCERDPCTAEQCSGKHLQICYPEKMDRDCLAFFKERYRLHSVIYKHHANCGSAFVICDILCRADPYYRIRTDRGRPAWAKKAVYKSLPISRAVLDPYAFLQLKDSIMDIIAAMPDENLGPAQELILSRYEPRALYKMAEEITINMDNPSERHIWESMKNEEIAKQMLLTGGEHGDKESGDTIKLAKEDFIVDRCTIHHGQKDQNPLMNMRFIPKNRLGQLTGPIESLPVAKKPNERSFGMDLPVCFQKNILRVYCRDPCEKKFELLSHVFEHWYFSTKDGILQTAGPPTEVAGIQEPIMLSQDSAAPGVFDYQEEGDDDYDGMIDLQSPVPLRNAKNDRNYN